MPLSITFILSGLVFGAGAGLSPGPMLTLVVSETIKHDIKEGIKISIAPLLTDIPIILFTIFILSGLSDVQPILGVISVGGALFLFYLGLKNISFKGIDLDSNQLKPCSIKKGVVTNFLNPHPYMFWLSIGAPTVLKALSVSLISSVLFIATFYVFLVGSKILVSILVEKSRLFLKSSKYVFVNRCLGGLLLIFAGITPKSPHL